MKTLRALQTPGWIFLVAFALRVFAAFTSVGFDHPNEIYRTLEPLAQLQGYSTHMAWEWREGLLSWVPIFGSWVVLQLAHLLGVRSALGEALFLRILFAAAGVLQVAASYALVRWSGASRKAAAFAALTIALWPEFIFHSIRLMDYSQEAAFFSMSLLFILRSLDEESCWGFIGAGVALGFCFFSRFQSGLDFLAVFILFSVQTERLRARRLGYLVTAYGATIACMALVDLPSGGFLSSFRNYVDFNLLQHGAEKFYGAQPWHRYLSELAKSYGLPAFVALAGLMFFQVRGIKRFSVLFLLPLLAHFFIQHKEARFIFGFSWLLVPIGLSKIDHLWDRLSIRGILIACFIASFALQLMHTVPRWQARSGEVRDFARIGEELRSLPESARTAPILIEGDPTFSPGAFYLRYRGKLCYRFPPQGIDECNTPGQEPKNVISQQGGHWVLSTAH